MVNPPKILMISYTSFIQKFYQTLPHEIAKNSGWDVKVLVPPYWKELWSRGKKYLEKDFDELYDITVGKIWFPGNLHFSLFRSQLKWMLQAYNPNIIDLENEPFNLGSLQLVLYRDWYSPQSKIVLHASQHQFKNYPPPFNFAEKHVLRKTDAILARNQMAVDVLRGKDFRGLTPIVTHGVNIDAFAPRNLPELRSKINPQGKIAIGFVGAMEEHKGLQHLIRAVENLNVRLLLVGDGDYKKNLAELAKSLNVDAVFIAHATHEEVAQYMNCMDIFVLPSLTRPNWVEKFGRVLIESMASGIAVIGSDSGEIPNVIGNGGLIFQEGNVEDLRNKIQTLVADKKLRNELGWKGRKRAQSEFSWKNIAQKTIDVYSQLLFDQKQN